MKNKKKNFNYFGSIGIVLYIIISLVDRAIYKLPDLVYILFMLVAITFVVVGIVIDKKNKRKSNEKI